MRLNWLGRATMNNWLRVLAQYYAAHWMERLGGRLEGGRALEVGCGRGVGVQIILERFGAASVEAIDLDPKMIECAHRRLGARGLAAVQLSVGNVTRIQAGDATFDAVFDFGAIHLEPEWVSAIAEVRRVLKPGGRFFFEWVTGSLLRLPYPFVTEGFRRMEVPNPTQLMQALERQGIIVGKRFVCPRVAALTGFAGDLVGVGLVAGPVKGSRPAGT
jgi:ubiquinone/menaquinone biosynthesis C-methylase UbiE